MLNIHFVSNINDLINKSNKLKATLVISRRRDNVLHKPPVYGGENQCELILCLSGATRRCLASQSNKESR